MRGRWRSGAALAAVLTFAASGVPASAAPTTEELAFTSWVGDDLTQSLLVLDTATQRVRRVAPGTIGDLTWSADGNRVVWTAVEGDSSYATSLRSARPDGTDVRTLFSGSALADVAAAPDGSFALARSDLRDGDDCATNPPVPAADITLVGADGTARRLTDAPVSTWGMAFSRDSSTLVWAAVDGDPCGQTNWPHLNLTDVASGVTRAVTGARSLQWASFADDGATVIAATSDEFGQDLLRVDVATAVARRVETPDFAETLPSVSPDGTTVAVVRTPVVPDPGTYFRSVGEPHVVVLDLFGRLVRDLGQVPEGAEHLTWNTDGTVVAVDGATFVPFEPGSDVGSADPWIWTFPVDGTPTEVSRAGGFSSVALQFRPRFPQAPVVERHTRTRR